MTGVDVAAYYRSDGLLWQARIRAPIRPSWSSMIRFMTWIGDITTGPVTKYVVGGITVVLFVWSFYITLFDSKIGQATPGSPLRS